MNDPEFVKNNMKEFLDKTVENIINQKRETNFWTKNFNLEAKKQIEILKSKNYYINDDKSNTSKLIYAEILQIQEMLGEYHEKIKPLFDEIGQLTKVLKGFNIAQITIGVLIAGLAISNFFLAGTLTPLIAALGALSTILGTIQVWLATTRDYLLETKEKVKIVMKGLKTFAKDRAIEAALKKLTDILMRKMAATGVKNVSSSISNLIGAGIIIGVNTKELLDKQIKNVEMKVFEKTKYLNKRVELLRKNSKFVVVSETPQYGDYNEGGYGGKNLIFRNLTEEKDYTLEDLLAMDEKYLWMFNLIKVYDKNKGWYVKTRPNKMIEDNLG
ncbi:Uncharacterised protein [Metamycoplasma arthritidis]|uniref:Hypothetical membrane protein n=1 Tax=Metamycoplasma arthritidis (strain 158L3-1) TaxID=243272 RepID=B3PMY4_META1|nr:hypothetical protein [Metamycoplasma arthritidis]ACF07386.1 hypothetical membrane protein [Metamycoplasma arthritidis 158L3-1]VEU78907.1 Uncharacterised protein [Metamycoplasma arthritidis]